MSLAIFLSEQTHLGYEFTFSDGIDSNHMYVSVERDKTHRSQEVKADHISDQYLISVLSFLIDKI